MGLSEQDKAEIRNIVKVSTEETITETFKVLGIDIEDFDHIAEFRDNHTWVKRYRSRAEAVGSKVLITITTLLTGGIIAAILAYIGFRPPS